MLNEQSNERVLFSGYAKLPVGITAAEMYKVIGVIVVVDMKSGLIVKGPTAHWRLNWHGNILRSALLVTTFPMGTKSCRIF